MNRSSFPRATVLLLFAFGFGCKAKPSAPLRVAAAADLAHAFDEIRPAFTAQTPGEMTVTLGSTGLLARQLAQGAPFDLFLAANSAYVEQVVKAGACDGRTIHSYARGRLVIWVKGSEGAALTLASLADARFKHIAIANPEHAPYGAAAREALTRAGVWSGVSARMVYGENVQQTLELAQTGNADVAVVGLSLVLGVKSGSWSLVDESEYTPIDQALVVCNHGGNAVNARKLAEFLGAPTGRAILRKYGFLLPGEALAKAP
ncbi:MAG TPA: molybdate ABC transporter substrate-binding protein [Polyangiaceae bacterium]|jgi:molybdate transport system substrate-binding protein|nr:molybdate ABC transporter substrate-binding protein [Polyangiaceae bacterium]